MYQVLREQYPNVFERVVLGTFCAPSQLSKDRALKWAIGHRAARNRAIDSAVERYTNRPDRAFFPGRVSEDYLKVRGLFV